MKHDQREVNAPLFVNFAKQFKDDHDQEVITLATYWAAELINLGRNQQQSTYLVTLSVRVFIIVVCDIDVSNNNFFKIIPRSGKCPRHWQQWLLGNQSSTQHLHLLLNW